MTEETIFAQALDRQDPTERQTFLDAACAGDGTLRRRVEALLESHEGSGQFLRQPALRQLAACSAEGSTEGAETPPDPEMESASGDLDALLHLLQPAQRPGSLGRFKHYEVLQVVGRGGFGTVLKVFDDKLHRVVAIKVLAAELAASATARQRFLREARAAAAVRHEHVIDIHAVDEQPIPHLVMEYVEGQTLQEKLDRTGKQTLKVILRIGLQIAEGLAAAHKQGLIHRDIKPSNILLENGVEKVKISDFGLARLVDDASQTQSGVVAGTPQYMSPEQAEGQALDQRSDLFSAGSVLYTMCCGRPPFRAETALATLRRVVEDTPRPVRECNPDLPDWLAAIIARLHAKKPAERIQTARELADLLAAHLADLQAGGAATRQPARVAPPAPNGSQRSRWLPGSVILVPILIVAALALVIFRVIPGADSNNALPGPEEKLPPAPAASGDAGNLPQTPFLHKNHGIHHPVQSLVYTPDGKFMASSCGRFDPGAATFTSWEVVLWDAVTGKAIRDFPELPAAVHSLACSPDGRRLVTGCRDGTVKAWDMNNAKELLDLKGQVTPVRSVAYSPDGKLIAAGASKPGGQAILWDALDGTKKFAFDKQADGVLHVAFSPDSSLLASAGDHAVHVWEYATGKEILALPGFTYIPRGTVFSHDNKRLVTVGEHGVPQVWDLATQQAVLELKGHLLWVLSVACSQDGAYFATSGTDGTVRLWDAATGQHNRIFFGHNGFVECVAFHPDGKKLAYGDGAGQIYVWDLVSGQRLFPQHHAR
jgi:serine/threonine protein kinase/roadblock/LC7 domain-containing protein